VKSLGGVKDTAWASASPGNAHEKNRVAAHGSDRLAELLIMSVPFFNIP